MSHIDFLGLPSLDWMLSYGATFVIFMCCFIIGVMFAWHMLKRD